ncbi:protein FMP52, mitochondrial [Spathaspora passalidarum NRRL Y-27907]|uniref:Protein FMP52, mitochondrial n=1 Tax=Spathaspora passalidarum (strain NRRL Y-27907 / 11-Y1) TaxID=619300 RepID=G3APX5_SPAPN|nr:protein FMP52, mitochondrial [Spathaspora passalidarum NRRL Y-27907]EGW32296.1 protein FMP52, mitochondrial [Spathaspora passalidarum NRRL Y-27907]
MSLFILGATGLVGAEVVKYGEKSSVFEKVIPLIRRHSKLEGSKISVIEEPDTSKWPEVIANESKSTPIDAFISALGSTRAKAGSAENFRKIDYGINYENFKAAKENGVKTAVLVSSIGANAKSWFLYPQTKGKLEDDVIALGFEHTVILRPGALLGERESAHGWANGAVNTIGRATKGTFFAPVLHPIEGADVAKVAVDFAEKSKMGKLTEKVTIVSAGELVKLASKL